MTKRWFSTIFIMPFFLSACGSSSFVPSAETNLIDVLKTRPSLTQFTKSLEDTGVAATLQEGGDYTIFAPVNFAVQDRALDEATVLHHILQERVTFSDIAGETTSYTTLHTDEIEIDATETIRVGEGLMVESDITATNGVIHVIDTVLTPEDLPTRLGPTVTRGISAFEGPVKLAPPNNLVNPEQPATGVPAVIPAAPTITQ